MYAVIRAGGKQYRVAPGDVIRVEKVAPANGKVEFSEVLLVSREEGQVVRPQQNASVTAEVLEQGRGDKVLVFHFKRKKQYKKLAGHRQPFTAVRITEIAFDGQKWTAEPRQAKAPKPAKPAPAAAAAHEAAHAKPHAKPHAKAAPPKKAAAAKKKPAGRKSAAKPAAKKSSARPKKK
jgi:large subunit ribosomal protein L21